jgi:hypothetical protein
MSSEMLTSEEEIQKAADKAAAESKEETKVEVDLPGKALPKPEEIMNKR